VQSEDYLQAFEQLNRLNLKKTQQREIVRVLFHCCLAEKTFNPYYALVCQRLVKFDPTNYRYTVKYVIWDYLKGLDTLSITKVVNLSRICGFLLAHEDIPMHFFKVIDFTDVKNLSKPTVLFLHLMLQAVLDAID
jgi:nucleolar MIF4G domain-containing protein 1